MSNKKWCPSCDSYTSTAQTAWDQGGPCPYCNLGWVAWNEVLSARRRYRETELRAKYEKLLVDYDKMENRALEAEKKLARIKINL